MHISLARARRLSVALIEKLRSMEDELKRKHNNQFDVLYARYMALNGVDSNLDIRVDMANHSLGIPHINTLNEHLVQEAKLLKYRLDEDTFDTLQTRNYKAKLRTLLKQIAENRDKLDQLDTELSVEVIEAELILLDAEYVI